MSNGIPKTDEYESIIRLRIKKTRQRYKLKVRTATNLLSFTYDSSLVLVQTIARLNQVRS